MIGLEDSIGHNSADILRLMLLGALRRQGRSITPAVRATAAEFGRAFVADDTSKTVEILRRLGVDPDEVLPPDDNELAEVRRLGDEADAQGAAGEKATG